MSVFHCQPPPHSSDQTKPHHPQRIILGSWWVSKAAPPPRPANGTFPSLPVAGLSHMRSSPSEYWGNTLVPSFRCERPVS